MLVCLFFFKQKTAYEMRISDWSSDVCSSDLTWAQRSVLVLSCSLVLGLLGSAGVLGYVYLKYSRLPRIELGGTLTERTGSDEPQNFLLVGIDSAANLAEDEDRKSTRLNSSH